MDAKALWISYYFNSGICVCLPLSSSRGSNYYGIHFCVFSWSVASVLHLQVCDFPVKERRKKKKAPEIELATIQESHECNSVSNLGFFMFSWASELLKPCPLFCICRQAGMYLTILAALLLPSCSQLGLPLPPKVVCTLFLNRLML